MPLKAWLSAVRLRTLPLAMASIAMGSFLAAAYISFNWWIFIFCALTTIFLQVLSNLANDYGDSVNGADSDSREGPARAVQSGRISLGAMKKAMYLFGALSLISGITLLYLAFGTNLQAFLFFFLLGLLSIAAAVAYTAGKNPYGYAGLGDVSVFVFFGLVGVLGTFYLHTGLFHWVILLPALSCGFFAAAVLNVNNIRDINSDRLAGKKSIPVRIGRKNAFFYHCFLLIGGVLAAISFVIFHFIDIWQLLFLLAFPLLFLNARAVLQQQTAGGLDPYLKQMALSTLLFVILFGLGLLLSV